MIVAIGDNPAILKFNFTVKGTICDVHIEGDIDVVDHENKIIWGIKTGSINISDIIKLSIKLYLFPYPDYIAKLYDICNQTTYTIESSDSIKYMIEYMINEKLISKVMSDEEFLASH